MTDFLYWIEGWPTSIFVRESSSIWAFPMFLFVHTLGIGLIAGGNTMIDFAVLGLWPKATGLKPLEKIYPIIWWAFGFNAFTGFGLLFADMSTKGINPVFYAKMICMVFGLVVMVKIRKILFHSVGEVVVDAHLKRLAWTSLGLWFLTISFGRLIAYVGPVVGLFL